MNTPLGRDSYRSLLISALPIATDTDTVPPNSRTLFTPDGHRLALEPEVTVVRGGRGVGKTLWFDVLQDELLRAVAADAYQLPRLRSVQPYAGFGLDLAPERYPGPLVLYSLVANGSSNFANIWTAVLLKALGDERVREISGWPDRIAWVERNPEEVEHVLARADQEASKLGRTRLIVFDALEHLHADRRAADALVGGILRLALDLRTRTRNLRAKVFIRHDMFNSAHQRFPDSSKLLANAADLTWTEPNLYGLLFSYLGNAESPDAVSFRDSHGPWRKEGGEGEVPPRFVPPGALVGDRETQQKVFVEIAGSYMGSHHRKGHTYTWLPNHLMDGKNQVSPRSFLRALKAAVEVTRTSYADYRYALHYEGIRRGVQAASSIRVAEITEDLPWVAIAVRKLAGLQVPIDRESVVQRWRELALSDELRRHADSFDLSVGDVRTGPKEPDNYPGLVAQLTDLGVMTERADGRVDLPDVYRIAFSIGRRGGVPRLPRNA